MGSHTITPAQCRRFAAAYHANGGNAMQAMGQVFPTWSHGALNAHAGKMLARSEVQAELRTLGGVEVVGLLSAEERRQFLAGVVRACPASLADGKSHLAQSVTMVRRVLESGEVEERITVKMPDKLRAVQLDAQLAGDIRSPGEELMDGMAPLMDGMAALMGLGATPPAAYQANTPDEVESIL